MREYEPPHAEQDTALVIEFATDGAYGTAAYIAQLVLLFGPGRSSGNILWTYGVVSENVLRAALEVEISPASGEVVKRTPIPRNLCSGMIVMRAEQFGIEAPVSESMRALKEHIRKLDFKA